MHGINCECQHNSCNASCFQSKKRLYHFLKAWHTLRSIFESGKATHSITFSSGQAKLWSDIILSSQRQKSNYLCEIHKRIAKLHTSNKNNLYVGTKRFWCQLLVAVNCWVPLDSRHDCGLSWRNITLPLEVSHHPFLFPKTKVLSLKGWKKSSKSFPYWKELVAHKITLKISRQTS